MSLKRELQIWSDALVAYDKQDFDLSLSLFRKIADTSKVFFNVAIIQATLGRHELALRGFDSAIELDEYLAIAYYQSGVSNFMLRRYPQARKDFDDAFIYMRGNMILDYEQIGLKHRLYSCEVMFNRGIASISMGQYGLGMRDLESAVKEKQTLEHGVIDDAIADRAQGYTVFSIPVGLVFRPSDKKLKNLETKNYLGQAKLVAATEASDAFTGFSGTARRVGGLENRVLEKEDAPKATLSRSKSGAARLQNSIDGRAPSLRRRPTLDGPGSNLSSDRGLMTRAEVIQEEEDLNAVINFMAGEENDNRPFEGAARDLLPTPPRSEQGGPAEKYNDRGTTGYGELIGSYLVNPPSEPVPPLQLSKVNDRVTTWARQTTRGAAPPLSTSQPNSRQNSAATSGLSAVEALRRQNSLPMSVRPARTGTLPGPGGESSSMSGASTMHSAEMSKVRVKLRYEGDTRGMSIGPDLSLTHFKDRVRAKFEAQKSLPMKYKDADGAMISIIDDDDWETAMDSAREFAQGRPEGKLEILLT